MMSQQTQIDQFYPLLISKRSAVIVSNGKKDYKRKSVPYIKNQKRKTNDKQCVSMSPRSAHSNPETDCMIVYDKINNTPIIDLCKIQMQTDDYPFSSSKNDNRETPNRVVGIKRTTYSVNNDSPKKARSKSAERNDDRLDTPKRHSKMCKSPNRRILNNHNLQSKNKPKENLQKTNVSSISTNLVAATSAANKEPSTPEKHNYSNSKKSPSSTKSSYSPLRPSTKSPKPTVARKLFGQTIDVDITKETVNNMNLVKQGAIRPNNFDLEEIYSKTVFHYEYSCINSNVSTKYELEELVSPNNLHSKILFTSIFKVLSSPVNCGYFDESEMDFIYSMITLPEEPQALLARMIKRRRDWFRGDKISYPEIAEDLHNAFKILESRSMCTFNIESESLPTILQLLQANEIRQICQKLKLNPNGKKNENIDKLINLSNNKALFSGMKSPSSGLYSTIFATLNYCVRITDKTWNVVDKVMTLLIPNPDPKKGLAHTFFMLSDVFQGKVLFPDIPVNRFPVFSSKFDLMSYIQAKSILFIVYTLIENKNWDEIRKYGNLAMDTLSSFLENERTWLKTSTIPMHVRYYMKGYVWLKLLSLCIDAFKKLTDKNRVVEILKFLVEQDCHMQAKKGKWYNELALITMHHYKNIEDCTSVTVRAFETGTLTQVDKIDLMERANKILKRKATSQDIKIRIDKILNDHKYHMPKYEAAFITIKGTLMHGNVAGNKSKWCIESSSDSQSYGSVEAVAQHYYHKQEFYAGKHCEGELPIVLFFTLFWEELYHTHVPGAFVTPYQDIPTDLCTEHFYRNRKDKIDTKLQIVESFNSETLSCWMKERFEQFQQYQSAMNINLFKDGSELKDIVDCLGVYGVIGICKRLLENYRLWRAGFPDLIVWNSRTKQHKIVEVKGPKDTLSTKQRLWLEYLNQLGLNVEVCLVQGEKSLVV